jgi:hypothetical protein
VTGHGDYGNDHGYDRGVWKLRTLPLPDQERPGPARKRTCAVYGAESGCSMENGSICGGHLHSSALISPFIFPRPSTPHLEFL